MAFHRRLFRFLIVVFSCSFSNTESPARKPCNEFDPTSTMHSRASSNDEVVVASVPNKGEVTKKLSEDDGWWHLLE